MSDIRKKLLQEIDAKIAKKKLAKEKAASNKDVESFVADFMQEIDDIQKMVVDGDLWSMLSESSQVSLKNKIRTLDGRAEIEISWHEEDGQAPRVNGVLVRWSSFYQNIKSCEPELFVDVMHLLFK